MFVHIVSSKNARTNDTSSRATAIGRKSSLAIFTSTFKTQFTPCWQSSDDLRSKLKSELIKSSRNAPRTKSTDGSRDVKCTKVALVSVTCQFKPIGSLCSSANAGNSKINSSRAGSLFLAPFFSPALGCEPVAVPHPNKGAGSQTKKKLLTPVVVLFLPHSFWNIPGRFSLVFVRN